MICQNPRCGIEFKAPHKSRKYCSIDCHVDIRRKVDIPRLTKLVFTGQTKAEIAREFDVNYKTVRRWIAEFELEQMWREQRRA